MVIDPMKGCTSISKLDGYDMNDTAETCFSLAYRGLKTYHKQTYFYIEYILNAGDYEVLESLR
jgi:hypothetical protein